MKPLNGLITGVQFCFLKHQMANGVLWQNFKIVKETVLVFWRHWSLKQILR